MRWKDVVFRIPVLGAMSGKKGKSYPVLFVVIMGFNGIFFKTISSSVFLDNKYKVYQSSYLIMSLLWVYSGQV